MPSGKTPCKLVASVFVGPRIFISAVPINVVTAPSGAITGVAEVGCLYQQSYRDTFNCCGATTYVTGIQYTTERLGPGNVLPVLAASLPLPLAGPLGTAASVLGAGINIAVWWANPKVAAAANSLCGPGSVLATGKTGGTPEANCSMNLIFYPWGATQNIIPGPTPTPGSFLASRSIGAEIGGLLAYRSGVDELSKFPPLIDGFNARNVDVPSWFPQGTVQLDVVFDDGLVIPAWLSMKGGQIVRFRTTPLGTATTHIRADEETVTRFLTTEFPIDYFIKSITSGRLSMSALAARPALGAVPTAFDGLDPRDSLTRVEGIDATLRDNLGAAGVFQLSDLRDLDTRTVTVTGITRDRLARFKQAAGILFEFPQLTGDDVEVIMDGLGETSAERLRSGLVTFDADAVLRAVSQVRVPADYDPAMLMALFGSKGNGSPAS